MTKKELIKKVFDATSKLEIIGVQHPEFGYIYKVDGLTVPLPVFSQVVKLQEVLNVTAKTISNNLEND